MFAIARDATANGTISMPIDFVNGLLYLGPGGPLKNGSNAEFRRAEALAHTVLGVALMVSAKSNNDASLSDLGYLMTPSRFPVVAADHHFSLAAALDPWNTEVLCARANLRLDCKNIPGALRDLKEVTLQDSSLAEAYIMRASIFIDEMCDLKSAAIAAKEAHAQNSVTFFCPRNSAIIAYR